MITEQPEATGYVNQALNLHKFEVEWLAYLTLNPRWFKSLKSSYNVAAMESLVRHGYATRTEEIVEYGTHYWYSITRDGVLAALANECWINPELRRWLELEPE